MGILELLGVVASILAAVLPALVARWNENKKEREHDTNALIQRDIDELRAGLDKLRSPK